MAAYFLSMETKNTTLDEIAVYFDGDEARVSGGAIALRSKLAGDDLGKDDAVVHGEQV